MKSNHVITAREQGERATRTAEMGFTLIELSIVLVIIGLIVGGVLVGQDLIKAAEIRATVTQIEKYNSATNTFRNKYQGLPGDLLSANATFGFLGGSGVAGDRDGNGFIEGCAALAVAAGCETIYYWADLSTAGFLDQSIGANGASGTSNLGLKAITGSGVTSYFPPAKLGKGNYVIVYYNLGYNWFGIGGAATSGGAGLWQLSGDLTPNQAFNIDKKVDDSLPNTGIVQAISKVAFISATTTAWPADTATGTAPATNCLTGTASSSTYNVSTSAGDIIACAIGMRFN